MANALTYIRNVGKSAGYASVDLLKKMNPAVSDFADTNAGLMKDMYTSVKSLKKRAKDMPSKVMESQYGQFARAFRDNLMDDLKTGKFYNKERIERDEMNAMTKMMGLDEEDGMDFNFDSSDDFSFNDLSDNSSNEMMDLVGEKASMAVANATARSAEYIVQGQTEIAKVQYSQLNAIYGGLHQGLGTINKNISSLVTFATESATAHYNNSKTFFESSNAADNEKITILKDILENVKQLNSPLANKTGKDDTKGRYSDLVSSEGIVKLEDYAKNIKKNIKNNTGGVFDMLDMITETGALMTFASSPVSFLAEFIAPNILPNIMKKSMEGFNKSLSGMFGSAIMQLKEKSRRNGGIWESMFNILGIDNSLKTDIDPSKYEKGKVAFDGITRKSIVEVIPTYLSKIYSALSGNQESRFNYDTGKFVNVDDIRKEMQDMIKASADYAAIDVNQLVQQKKSQYKFSSDKAAKSFDEDWEALKEYMFKNGRIFNTRRKSKGSDYGLKGGMASDVNLEILRNILDGTPEMMQLADRIMKARDDLSSKYRESETRGDSILSALENGSVKKDETTKSPISSIDNGIIAELREIRKEISYIRTYGIGGSKTKGKGKSTSKKPSFESYNPFKTRTGNNTEYDKKQTEYEEYPNLTEDQLSSHVEGMIVSEKKTNEKDKEASFYDKMREASGISAKMAVLVKSATELAKKPATFVASMFDAADRRLYDLIYGPKEDKTGKKSFVGRMFNKLDGMFDKFAKFIDDTIIDPLKGKFTKENIHNAARKFFSFFGIDLDETVKKAKTYLFGEKNADGAVSKKGLFTDLGQNLKTEFSNVGKWVKNAFSDVGSWFGIDLEKRKKSKSLSKQLNDIAKGKKSADDIPTAATGMRRMDKTGLAILSEGEMVIPPDMNPFNIQKRKRNEKAVKDNIKEYGIDPSSIPTFAEGGEFIGPQESEEQLKKRKKDLNYTHIEEAMMDQAGKFFDFLGGRIKDSMKKMGLIDNDEEMDKLKNKASNLLNEAKEAFPSMATGATIGAGLSLVTGFIGGPLVGAAIGSAVGLAKRSETFQNMLFGEPDENGEYSGKLIPKNITNFIKKYLPDMAKGATVGGILTALPIIPGGPVAGIVIGSALGFAKNNESVQNAIFGEGKLFKTKEDFHKKVSSVLPKMGLGAIAGLLAGPFGLTTNLVLGSALGFASDTNKFKDFMFGTPDSEGNRKGGLFDAVTEPAIRFFDNMFNEFRTFTREKIMQPLKDAFDPLTQQFRLMVSAVTQHFKDKISMSVGQPLERLMKRMSEKIFGGLGKILNVIMKPVKPVVSAPFRAVGALGSAARKHQIKTGGTGRTMSAAARNAFRDSKGAKMFIGGADHYQDFDESLVDMDYEQIDQLQSMFAGIEDSRMKPDRIKEKAFKNIRKAVWEDADVKKTEVGKEILRLVKKGYVEDALKYLDKVGTDPKRGGLTEEQKDKLSKIISAEAAKMKTADAMKKDRKGTLDQLYEQAKNLGMKGMSRDLFDQIASSGHQFKKVQEMLDYEKSLRGGPSQKKETTTSDLNEEQEKRHNETLDVIKDIRELLKDLNGYNTYLEAMYKSRHDFIASHGEEGAEEADIADRTHVIPYIRRGMKATAKAPFKVIAGTGKAVGKGYKAAKGAAKKARNTDIANKVLGDKNDRWRKDSKLTTISEGEIIVPSEEPDENAVGSVGGDNNKNKKNKENPLFRIIKSIERGIKIIAGGSISNSTTDGLDQDTNVDRHSMTDYVKSVKRKAQNAKRYTTQFVNGMPVKIFKDKNGDENIDPSSAENKETLKKVKEQEETQKGIFSSLKSLPTTLSGLFGKKDEEKEESWVSKVFDKLKLGLAVAGGAAAIGLGAGVVKEHVAPIIGPWWENTAKPYLNDAWDGKKEGFGKFIYFFNPANPEGLVTHIKNGLNWIVTEGIPAVAPTIASYITSGFDWILNEGLPLAVSAIVRNFPKIVWGIVKGIGKGLEDIFVKKSNFNGEYAEDANLVMLGKARSGKNTPAWFDKNAKNMTLTTTPDWNSIQMDSKTAGGYSGSTESVSTNEASASSTVGVSGSTATSSINDKVNKAQVGPVKISSHKNKGYPRGITNLPEGYQSKAKAEFDKVRDNIIEFDEYGALTIYQVLDSDLVIAYDAETGSPIYGYDALRYKPTAKLLGINYTLTEEEMRKNTEENTVLATNSHADLKAKSTLLKAGRNVVFGSGRGVGGAAKIIKGGGTLLGKGLGLLSHVPVIGGGIFTKAAGKTAEAGAEAAAKAGTKADVSGSFFRKLFGQSTIREMSEASMDKDTLKNNNFWKALDPEEIVEEVETPKPGKKKDRGRKRGNRRVAKGKAKTKKAQSVADKVDDTVKKATKEGAENQVKKGSKALDTLKKYGKKLDDNVFNGFISNVKKNIDAFFKNNTVFNALSNGIKGLGKKVDSSFIGKFATKIGSEIAEYLIKKGGKLGAKAAAKIAAYSSTALILLVADAVVGFVSGYRNANTYLGVTEQPNIFIRALIGIAKAISETLCLGLIPLQWLIDKLIDLAGMLGIDVSAIQKEQEEAQKELDAYNKEHGTDLTLEEYNKKDRLSTKIKKGVTDIFKKGKEGVSDLVDKGKKGAKNLLGKAKGFLGFKDDDEIEKDLEEYNKKNGTKLTIDEYKEMEGTTVKKNSIAGFASSAKDKVKEGLDKSSDTFKKGVTTAKDIGGYAVDVTKQRIQEIITGKDFKAKELKIDKDDPYKSTKQTLYDVITIVTAPPFVISKGLHYLYDKFLKPVVDGVVTIGKGIGTTVKGYFSNAWNGKIPEMMSDDSGDANTDNKLVNTLSTAANNVVKFIMAPPALLASGIGFVVRNFSKVIDGIKNVGSGVGTTVGNIFSKGFNGDIIGAFTDTSGNANTGNKLVDGASTIINNVVKAVLSPTVLLTGAIGFGVKQIKNVVELAKTIGSGVSTVVTNTMTKATSGTNPLTSIFTNEGNANTGNQLIDGTSALINTIVKVPLTPIALLTTGVSYIKNKITDFASSIVSAGTVSDTDKQILEDAKDAKVSPFSKKYWTVNTTQTGLAKGLNMFVSFFQKVLTFPQALFAHVNPKKMVEKGVDWLGEKAKDLKDKVKGFIGYSDEETGKGSGNVSGSAKSGLSGKGSGIWGRGNKELSKSQVSSLARKSQIAEDKKNTKVSNNTFISQRDSKYSNKGFNIKGDSSKQTIEDSGCAPAAAAMAVNGTIGSKNLSMDKASDLALKYKLKDDGVNAAYFSEEFARNGINAQYITTDDPNIRKSIIAKQLANNSRVVLMGSDSMNKSKKDSPYGPNPHYVVANGMSKDGKYIYINDPEAKKGNIKYLANKVLNNSTLGIAATAARGSNLHNSKAMAKIMNSVGRGLPGADVAEQCWNYLRSNGFSEEATAGLLGNFRQESGMNPSALQNGRGPAAGLYQMEKYGDYSTRWGKMANYAKSKGRDWTDLECQLEYMIMEMPSQFKAYTGHGVHTYPNGTQAWWPTPVTVEEFKGLKDIAKAVEIFERVFERGSIPRMEKRIAYAKDYFQRFTGKFAQTGTASGGISGGTAESTEQKTWVDELYGVFGGLAEAYGLKTKDTVASDGSSVSGTPGAVGGNAQQQALVAMMKSKEGQLQYSQVKRNPDEGSGDCSSTVRWAYQKVLKVDPGINTTAMETDPDTYVVTKSFDESQMQPGDEILYNGHVEMYMGGGKMIGHGGGKNGTTPGPTVKPLDDQGRFRMVKRWVGFKGGNGSGLFGRGSDTDNKSKNKLEYAPLQTPKQRAYKKVEDSISNGKINTWFQLDNKDDNEDTQISTLSDSGKFIDITSRDNKKKPIYVAKGSSDTSNNLTNYLLSSTLTRIRDNSDANGNNMVTLMKTIIQLLGSVVTNTEQLNNIFKLLSEYLTILNSKDANSKNAVLARQNLIAAMQAPQQNGPNEQLMRLIKSAEEIASQ